jgi:hypothetical protein
VESGAGAEAQVENEVVQQKEEITDVSNAQEEKDADVQNTSAGWNANDGQGNGLMYGAYGFNGNQNGYPGMDWNQANGFNPMMQMQMQSNMSNGEWGGFPNMMGSFVE